mmetsp:Transcript_25632/g.73751  ORF Transcript_25632/g.73751 Transcript_25632/m.73751 type:complete len:268 (+) Transcript_25632:816-1619(+)
MRLHHACNDGLHHLRDPAVLPQEEVQLVVVDFELLLLEKDHFRRLGHLNAPHAVHDARLPDQLENLGVEVDVEAVAVVGMFDKQGRLQAGLDGFDGIHPRLVPQCLEFDERLSHLVVHPDQLLRVLRRENRRVALEFVHRSLDAFVQVARPCDVARDGREVPHDGRRGLALLVLVLHLVQLQAVVVEDHRELRLQIGAKVLALQDALQLVEKLQGCLDGRDRLEGCVDELTQAVLQLRDLHIEVHVVTVKPMLLEVQHVVFLSLEAD